VVAGLTVWNTRLTTSAWDLVGSALLLATGVACALASARVLMRSSNAVIVGVVSQIFIVCLAIYVWLVDLRSPVSQLLGVTGVALATGAVALAWVCYLAHYVRGALTKAAAVAVALFPLIGLVQFWLQTEYLPQTSHPMVDSSVELVPTGATGPVVHVTAKVTMHNRSTVQADVHAALLRVTAYPTGGTSQPAGSDVLVNSLGPAAEGAKRNFREVPTLPGDARVLYAEVFALPDEGVMLSPGETWQFNRVIDVDSRVVRVARLTLEGVIVTQRRLKDVHTCDEPQVSFGKEPVKYMFVAQSLHELFGGAAHGLCTESQFAPSSVVQDLVADHPLLRTYTVVDIRGTESPTLLPFLGTRERMGDLLGLVDIQNKIDNSYPTVSIQDSAEYAPSDADLKHQSG
jgi:hypothetical protein